MPNHRKPLALALLHGNPSKRTLNRNQPQFKGLPVCPIWLHPIAKQEWGRVMSEFVHTRLITAPDMAALACFAQSYARWIQAEEQVTREGQIIKEPIPTRSGNLTGRHKRKKHPSVSIAKDERALMISAGRLFGFDPVSRQHIVAPKPESTQPEDDNDSDIFVN